jgi:hypothetical protein
MSELLKRRVAVSRGSEASSTEYAMSPRTARHSPTLRAEGVFGEHGLPHHKRHLVLPDGRMAALSEHAGGLEDGRAEALDAGPLAGVLRRRAASGHRGVWQPPEPVLDNRLVGRGLLHMERSDPEYKKLFAYDLGGDREQRQRQQQQQEPARRRNKSPAPPSFTRPAQGRSPSSSPPFRAGPSAKTAGEEEALALGAADRASRRQQYGRLVREAEARNSPPRRAPHIHQYSQQQQQQQQQQNYQQPSARQGEYEDALQEEEEEQGQAAQQQQQQQQQRSLHPWSGAATALLQRRARGQQAVTQDAALGGSSALEHLISAMARSKVGAAVQAAHTLMQAQDVRTGRALRAQAMLAEQGPGEEEEEEQQQQQAAVRGALMAASPGHAAAAAAALAHAVRQGIPAEERGTARVAEDAAWLALQSARLDASVDATAAAAGAAAASAAHLEVRRVERRLQRERARDREAAAQQRRQQRRQHRQRRQQQQPLLLLLPPPSTAAPPASPEPSLLQLGAAAGGALPSQTQRLALSCSGSWASGQRSAQCQCRQTVGAGRQGLPAAQLQQPPQSSSSSSSSSSSTLELQRLSLAVAVAVLVLLLLLLAALAAVAALAAAPLEALCRPATTRTWRSARRRRMTETCAQSMAVHLMP